MNWKENENLLSVWELLISFSYRNFLLELYNHQLCQMLMYYNFNSSWLSNGGWEFASLTCMRNISSLTYWLCINKKINKWIKLNNYLNFFIHPLSIYDQTVIQYLSKKDVSPFYKLLYTWIDYDDVLSTCMELMYIKNVCCWVSPRKSDNTKLVSEHQT